MKFRNESHLHHPRDVVFAAYRDKLSDVVPFLDDIKAVNVLKREDAGGTVKLHNEWVSDREIPKIAQGILKPEHLRWDDFATWDAATSSCKYEIKTRMFTDKVRCVGHNTFLDDGKGGTRIVLEGDFEISLKDIPGVPWLLAGTIAPQVEKFILGLIQPNLEKTNAAVGQYLDSLK